MKLFWTRLVLVLILVLPVLAACGGSEAESGNNREPTTARRATERPEATEEEEPTEKPAAKPTATEEVEEGTSTAGWKQFNIEEGNFTILMPSEPEEDSQQVETEVGTVDLYTYQVVEGQNVYMVSYTDYPPEKLEGADPDEMLDGAVQGQVSRFNGTLDDSDNTELRGFPGRLVKMTIPDLGTAYGSLFLVNNRLYQNLLLMQGGDDEALAEEFLGSFDLLDDPGGGDTPGVGDLPSGWQEFESQEGNFIVAMPGKPEEDTQQVETEVGTVDLYTYQVIETTAVYMVSYTDYPTEKIEGANPDEMLDGAVEGQVSRFNGTLEQSEEIDLQGYPGRRVEITIPDLGTAYGTLFLVNNRLYQNLVLLQNPSDEDQESAQLFLESFNLLEP